MAEAHNGLLDMAETVRVKGIKFKKNLDAPIGN